MSKESWKAGTLIYPLPAILVSCANNETGEVNVFTASWVGTVCTNPPMCYVSIRPERHSYHIIKESMEFALNLTTYRMAEVTDWCGVVSGKRKDKFAHSELLKTYPAKMIQAPLLEASPISLECKVKEIIPLGSHDMFLAEVVNVQADTKYLDPDTGGFDMEKAGLLAYAHGEYFKLGEFIGHFGWSVSKKKQVRKPRRSHHSNSKE